MIEVAIFIGGLVFGGIATSALMDKRIKDHIYFTNARLQDYKDSFNKGFQAKNGYQAYKEEAQPVNQIHSTDNEFSHEAPNEETEPKKERWDD